MCYPFNMSKPIERNARFGRFIVGRAAAQQFNAVEGIHASTATTQMLEEARGQGKVGDALRKHIREEFARKQ